MICMCNLQQSTSTTVNCSQEQTVCGAIQELLRTDFSSEVAHNVTEEVLSVGSTQTGICNVRITCDLPQTLPLHRASFAGFPQAYGGNDFAW